MVSFTLEWIKLDIVRRRRRPIFLVAYLFYVLHSLHGSKKNLHPQRKVVTYGRSIKDRSQEKKLTPFRRSLISSFNYLAKNLHGCPINNWSIEEKKSFGLFFVLCNLFINLTEKNIIHQLPRNKKEIKYILGKT